MNIIIIIIINSTAVIDYQAECISYADYITDMQYQIDSYVF